MNKFLSKQIFSYFLTASLLLSFWICVENCQAEAESDSENSRLVGQKVQAENTEKDSCSIHTSPSALFSNQELFISTGSASLPNRFWKLNSRQNFPLVRAKQIEKSFVKLPIQILRQLRV